jgi:hypothetical protein
VNPPASSKSPSGSPYDDDDGGRSSFGGGVGMRGEGRRRAVAEDEDELEGNAERAKNAAVVE